MFIFPVSPGFATTYGGLVTVRVFLGLVEGPLVPVITLLLSSFYTRKELAFRYVEGLLLWCHG
jgi:MFS family permease